MRVLVESLLPCDAGAAWTEVQSSALLLEVVRPFLAIRPAEGAELPDRWAAQQTVRCVLYLFGLIPLGTHDIFFEQINSHARSMQTRERSRIVRRWDHCIRVDDSPDGACRYTDEVCIEAGLWTPLVWLFACCFYRHRHRRWKAVANRLRRLSDG